MRLIDADALIKRLKKDWPQTSKITWAQIVAKCAPTIDIVSKDMVEVVRCEDCIHRYATGDVTRYYVCDFMDAQYEDDGYCHHGEREKK